MKTVTQKSKETPKVPMRKCIGCMESKPKKDLVRIAFYDDKLTLDVTGKAKGRGVYLCKDPKCIGEAKKRNAFNRSFKRNFDIDMINTIFRELEDE